MKYIIDTDLYIELLRTGRYRDIIADIYVKETPNIYFCSVVAQELLSGVVSEIGRKNVDTLISPFERAGRIITPGHNTWKEAGNVQSRLRRERPDLKTKLSSMSNDILIAMTSKSIGATVVTLNASDFEAIKSVRNFSYLKV